MGRLIVILAAVAGVAYYPMSCWLAPWARCLWCKGSGRKARKDGKVWRDCRWCRGSGRRMRVGRWIYNHYAKTRKKAS